MMKGPKNQRQRHLKESMNLLNLVKYYTTANVSKPQMKEKEKASTLRHQKLVLLMVSVYVCACMLERKRGSAERSNFSVQSIKIWGLYICASILIFISFSFSLFHGSRLCFQSRIFLSIFYIFCTLWLHQPLKQAALLFCHHLQKAKLLTCNKQIYLSKSLAGDWAICSHHVLLSVQRQICF